MQEKRRHAYNTSPHEFKQNSQQQIYRRFQTVVKTTGFALQMPALHPFISSSPVIYRHKGASWLM